MDWTKFIHELDEADARKDFEWHKHHRQIPDKPDEQHPGPAWETVGVTDPSPGSSKDDSSLDAIALARKPSRISTILYPLTKKPENKRRKFLMRGGAPAAPEAVPGLIVLRLYGRTSGRRAYWDLVFESNDQLSDFIRALKVIESPWLAGASERERIAVALHRFADLMVKPLDPHKPRMELARRFKIKERHLRTLIEKCDAALAQTKEWFLTAQYINRNAPFGIYDDGRVVVLFLQNTGEGYVHDLQLGTYTPISEEQKSRFPWVQWAEKAIPP